ncbi:MAG TPA: HepT-like ribonuclease domain-containing protein [Longimicrobiaceae bacterium]|nr:HepT-like ribonuclease domain-containing protein [Longimicrobiaceae bacterium]
MLLAARDVHEVAEGLTREQLAVSKRDQLALAKAVELVGEAASRVSEKTRQAHGQIPWRRIVGMRHRLVHDYQNLDLDILWGVVRDEIPPLIAALEPLIPPEDG